MQLSNPGAVIENTIRYNFIRDWFTGYKNRGVLLDLGCGSRPFYQLYNSKFDKTIGADIENPFFKQQGVDIYCSATSVPLPDASVDVILCTEVLQDIAEPTEFFSEVHRLLKPGGTLLMTTPYVTAIADGQYDHYRYTRFGLDYQFTKHGYHLESILPVSDAIGSAITLWSKPFLKFWNVLAKATHLKFIYKWYNPLLFLTVILPQVVYLLLRPLPLFKQLFQRFEYGCIGYISVATRKK
jgi:SAM-dependent methyltransferase